MATKFVTLRDCGEQRQLLPPGANNERQTINQVNPTPAENARSYLFGEVCLYQ